MAILGPPYDTIGDEYTRFFGLATFYFILVIISIPTQFFVNYKFVYKDFEVSKNKRIKLSFFTALANAPYEFLIPYGMIVDMIIDSIIF